MRRSLIFSVLIVVIALAVGSCLAIVLKGDQNSNSTNGNTNRSEVQIEDFQWPAGHWYTFGDIQIGISFNFTVHNLSGKEIDNLTVQIELFDANNSQVETSIWFEGRSTLYTNNSYPLGNLSEHESRTFAGSIASDLDKLSRVAYPLTAHVSLKMGDALLDELEVEVAH
jgi:hypothetical protein